MIGQQQGEINFYEELGVDPSASPEAIHDAYRALVRLLHPDQQTDPLLKEIAEKQMRKTNRIYAVLSDPERRRRYDDTLAEDKFPPTIVVNAVSGHPNARLLISRFAWIGAALVSAALLIWLASSQSNTAAPGRGRDPVSPAYDPSDTTAPLPSHEEAVSSDSEIQRLRLRVKALIIERDTALSELNKLRGPASPFPSESPPATEPPDPAAPAVTLAELPSGSKTQAVRSPSPATPGPFRETVNRRLAGFWFYTKPAAGQQNKNQSLYLPEYIEATITEENGSLRGKYRSRFLIPDRAISPDVNFSFSGSVNGPTVTCPWTGAGGASGEVTLTLMPNNSMRVDWTANEMGKLQGLASGTAILTRRIE